MTPSTQFNVSVFDTDGNLEGSILANSDTSGLLIATIMVDGNSTIKVR